MATKARVLLHIVDRRITIDCEWADTPYIKAKLPDFTINKKTRQLEGDRTFWTSIKVVKKLHVFEIVMSATYQNYYSRALTAASVTAREVQKRNLAAPDYGTTTLWRHQLEAYHFAMPRESCLLDMDMGTGKTLTALTLMMNRGHYRTLILAPAKVVEGDVWGDQMEQYWDPRAGEMAMISLSKGSNFIKMDEARRLLEDAKGAPFRAIVVSHDTFWRQPFFNWAKNQQWDLIIAEESHRLKSPGGRMSQALHVLGRRAEYRLALTGTPCSHRFTDAYGQFRFLDTGIFGTSYGRFLSRHAVMKQVSQYRSTPLKDPKAPETFYKEYNRITYHVSSDVQSLPKKHDLTLRTSLEPEARTIYTNMAKEMIAKLRRGEVSANNILTQYLRLQQISNGFAPRDEDGKLVRISFAKENLLRDVMIDIGPDQPIVIFTRFKADRLAVRRVCNDLGYTMARLDGQTNEFQMWKRGLRQVLCANIRSGSVSLDMTRSHYVIYYTLPLSLGDFDQSKKRVHRPGQLHPTFFIYLLVRATRDVTTLHALRQNKEIIQALLKRDLVLPEEGGSQWPPRRVQNPDEAASF